MATLKEIDMVIKNAIDVETHPDFNKNDSKKRLVENGYGKENLVHVLHGAIECNNKYYRVKITALEQRKNPNETLPHSFDVREIELIDTPAANSSDEFSRHSDMMPLNSISGAKLLKDVEMSYNKGKKVLEENEKRAKEVNGIESVQKQVDFHRDDEKIR